MSFPLPKPYPGPSYSTMFGVGSSGGALLGAEASGLAVDFTAVSNNLIVRDAARTLNYLGAPFVSDGGRVAFSRASSATRVNSSGLIETVANNVARLDFDPVTLAPRGLLVEEQRTNLLLQSEVFNSANWTKVTGNITANIVAAPSGSVTADAFIPTTTAGLPFLQQNATVVSGTVYTWSVFLKAAGYRWVFMDAFDGVNRRSYFDLQTGTIGNVAAGNTSTIINFGNGWYRCSLTRSAGSTSPAYAVAVATSNGGLSMQGDGTSGIYIWGAQVEAGAFATSYLPTVASTVTRSADVASVATSAFPYNVNSSSLIIAASQLSELAVSSWTQSLDNGTGNDRFVTIVGPNRPVNTQMTSSLVGQFNQSITPTSTTTPFKHAFAYELNNANMAVNGVLGTDDTTVTPPAAAATTLRIGTNTIQSVFFNGHIRQITYLPRRISNAELQARTS